MADKVRIGILGAGSIGCYLGGCLAWANYDVVLVGRFRIQQELKDCGLSITDWCGRNDHVDRDAFTFSLSAEALNEADFVIVTVKSGDTESAAQQIAEHCRADAVVVSFQNGIRNAELLQKHLPQMSVLTGMTPFNVINSGKGRFHCGTEGNLALGNKGGLETPLIEALRDAGLFVHSHKDMRRVQWGKLVMNLNNSINALSGRPLLEQLNNAEYRKVLAASIKEALNTLKIAGIKPARTGKVVPALLPFILSLPNPLFRRIASAMLKIDPEARSSMAEDLKLKRKTEIDYLNGEIASLAESLDVSAPVNLKIAELVKAAENKKQGSPNISPNELVRSVLG